MNEGLLEQMEKYLPRGFFMLYLDGNNDFRLVTSNPLDDPEIDEMIQIFNEGID